MLGRPPSDSRAPASTTRPSSIRSPTTLLTAGWLSPVLRDRSCLVSGPSRKSLVSSADRLRCRTLRLVARSTSTAHPVLPALVTVEPGLDAIRTSHFNDDIN